MKARLVDALGRDHARAAHHFRADGNSDQRILAGDFFPFRDCQHRGHDHRAGMHRSALEGVVEVLAVRGGAVDEGRAGGIEGARMSDGGAAPVGFPGRERRAHVVRFARRHAQAGDVDEEFFSGFAKRFRLAASALDAGGEPFRDRLGHEVK